MEAIRDEKMQIVGYRQQGPDGRVNIRNRKGELVGWTVLGRRGKQTGRLFHFSRRGYCIGSWLTNVS